MVINMMATKEVWPFFAIGFCVAAVSDLTLIALGVIAVSMALIYLKLSENAGSGNGGSNTGCLLYTSFVYRDPCITIK